MNRLLSTLCLAALAATACAPAAHAVKSASSPTPSPSPAATPVPSALPAKVSAPTPAPTSTPSVAPVPSPTFAPVQAPTFAPVQAPTVAPAQLPSDAPPKIENVSISAQTVHSGDTLHGIVITSSNTASVEARIVNYSISVPKVGVGRFVLTYKVPWIPFFWNGTYQMVLIARNTAGVQAERSIPITVR